MPDFSLLPDFFRAIARNWIAAMSGTVGVALFVGSLIAEWRKKPITFGFLFFAILGFLISVYEAWRGEYVKNIGESFFTFSALNPRKLADQSIEASLTVRNETQKNLEIEEVRIVKMWVHDVEPFVGGPIINWCKLMNISPQVSRMPPYQATSFRPPENQNVWFEYLENTKIVIDGTDRTTTATMVDPGKGYI